MKADCGTASASVVATRVKMRSVTPIVADVAGTNDLHRVQTLKILKCRLRSIMKADCGTASASVVATRVKMRSVTPIVANVADTNDLRRVSRVAVRGFSRIFTRVAILRETPNSM